MNPQANSEVKNYNQDEMAIWCEKFQIQMDKNYPDKLDNKTKSEKTSCSYANANHFKNFIEPIDFNSKSKSSDTVYTDEQFYNDLEKWFRETKYKSEYQSELSQSQAKCLEKALEIAKKIKPDN